MSRPQTESPVIDLDEQPGHLIRRAQQIAVSMFFEAQRRDVTLVQRAILRTRKSAPALTAGEAVLHGLMPALRDMNRSLLSPPHFQC